MDVRLPDRGRPRRPRRDDRDRHERRAAAAAARIPGPHDRARPLRLRERHQVAQPTRPHHLGRSRRLLGALAAGRATRRSRPSRASTCPARGEEVPRGIVPIAGIAWAQHRGVAKVEVRIDDGRVAGGEPRHRRHRSTRGGSGATTGTPPRSTPATTASRCEPPTPTATPRPKRSAAPIPTVPPDGTRAATVSVVFRLSSLLHRA